MGTEASALRKIAGFVDDQGTLTDLFGPGIVRIYDLRSGLWTAGTEFGFTLAGTAGLGQMRTKIHRLAEELEDCKVLLLGEVKGVLPALLGEQGVAVSQVSGKALERLAQVTFEEPKDRDSMALQPAPVEPTEVDTGVFRIDLAAAMGDNPRLTSRDILVPILGKGGFTLLEIHCDHPPRWLDTDGRKLGFGYEAAPKENPRDGFVVTVYPDPGASDCGPASGDDCQAILGSGGCSQGCSSRFSDESMDL